MVSPPSRSVAAFIGVATVAVALRIVVSYLVGPLTDVYYYDSQAVSALLAGMDPYGHLYAGIPPALATPGAEKVFAYPPGVFALLVPLAPFDARVPIVLSELTVGSCIFALGGRRSLTSCAVFLLLPTGAVFTVIYPNNLFPALAFLGLGVLLEARGRGVASAALVGLACASNQLVLLAYPFFLLIWYRRGAWKEPAFSLLSAGLAVMPFLLWDPGSFLQDTLFFEFARPVLPLISTQPWGLNLNPSLSGVAAAISPSPVPPLARGLLVLGAMVFFLWRSGGLRSTLLQLGCFLAVAVFVLPGDFFWVYLELPFAVLMLSFALPANLEGDRPSTLKARPGTNDRR